jgi:hypothetical protein
MGKTKDALTDAGIFMVEKEPEINFGNQSSLASTDLPPQKYDDHAALNTAFTIVLWLLVASLALNIWLLAR